MAESSLNKRLADKHYKDMLIRPIDHIHVNALGLS